MAAAIASARRNVLESAVMRPKSGYYPSAISEAAALWESLSRNHPFIDGDKRTAIASMAAYRFVTELYASGRFRMSELEPWLRTHVITGSFDR